MCGITGFCDFSKKSNKDILITMTDILRHRGPDDSGYSFYMNEFAHIGLGHRRLSILDLSTRGHQPMSFEHLEIVFNGEIYNFLEIAKELESFGYIFDSHSDTEVLIKAYHRWGMKAIDKFIGMFAIVIYDKKNQKLIFIRDRTGVKPLYYYYRNGLFLFASELKSFHLHPHFQREINIDALGLFFQYGYILSPHTIFKNTYKLLPGHYSELDIKNSEFKIYKYWDVIDCYNKPKLNISFEEAKKETENLIKSACEYRMVADVPVGIFLSGGYDSTLVTALLQKDRTVKLKTFTIGFYEKNYNEANYAKKVAEYLGTDHTEYYCTQKDAQELLPFICEIWDEPFGDSSIIPTMLVSRLARKSVKVSLSADGGDEIFGGYDKYIIALKFKKFFSKIPFRNIIKSLLEAIPPKYLIGFNRTYNFLHRYEKLKMLLIAKDEIDMIKVLSYYFTPKQVYKILNKGYQNNLISFDESIFLNSFNNDIDRMMAIDYKTYQLDDILTKVDRATMSISLEGREPLLDHRIIEFVSRLPSSYKIKGDNKKYILKSIVHDYIPKEMIDRPKQGFSIPITEWLGDELKKYIENFLNEENVKKFGILNYSNVKKIKLSYLNGYENASRLWLLLVFQMWCNRWIK